MRCTLSVVALFLILPSLLMADVPETLSYQGVLTDAGGVVVADGSYDVTFRLYDVPSGGSPLWEETQSLQVVKGIFNAVLGSSNPLTLPFDTTYYLGISVGGGAELTPRVELTSAPYSLNSDMVRGANILPSTGYVGVGTDQPDRDVHINRDADEEVGIIIENNNMGASSTVSVTFADENGGMAAIALHDDDHPEYSGAMSILNNRPGGYINFLTGSLERMVIAEDGRVGIGVKSPIQMLDVSGGIRIDNTATGVAGSIRWTGTDFEGYDGSGWLSLTSLGGSLPSGTDGQTLRHSRSGWEAVSNLYNDGENIGIGTTTPLTRLDILGGNWDLDNTEGDLRIGNEAYRLEIGVDTSDASKPGTAYIRSQGGWEQLVLGSGSEDVMKINGHGIVNVGSYSLSSIFNVYGAMRLYRSGLTTYGIRFYTDTEGGRINLYDELGTLTATIKADEGGEGGWLKVQGGESSFFTVDGYGSISHQAKVTIFAPSTGSGVVFDVGKTGDESVLLPNNSVSAVEMLNEGGVASAIDGYIQNIGDGDLLECTITAPSSGYVLVIATTLILIDHYEGDKDAVSVGISDVSGEYNAPWYRNRVVVPASLPTSGYESSTTVHGLFPVDAGTKTFYMVSTALNSPGSARAGNRTMTCIFIPTAYGNIDSPYMSAVGSGGNPSTQVVSKDRGNERERSIRANMERIQRELDEMRRQLDEIIEGE